MRFLPIIILLTIFCGCGKPTAETKKAQKKPSATQQAFERATGQTAVKAYKHTQNVLGDVKTVIDERHGDLQKLKNQ